MCSCLSQLASRQLAGSRSHNCAVHLSQQHANLQLLVCFFAASSSTAMPSGRVQAGAVNLGSRQRTDKCFDEPLMILMIS